MCLRLDNIIHRVQLRMSDIWYELWHCDERGVHIARLNHVLCKIVQDISNHGNEIFILEYYIFSTRRYKTHKVLNSDVYKCLLRIVNHPQTSINSSGATSGNAAGKLVKCHDYWYTCPTHLQAIGSIDIYSKTMGIRRVQDANSQLSAPSQCRKWRKFRYMFCVM